MGMMASLRSGGLDDAIVHQLEEWTKRVPTVPDRGACVAPLAFAGARIDEEALNLMDIFALGVVDRTQLALIDQRLPLANVVVIAIVLGHHVDLPGAALR